MAFSLGSLFTAIGRALPGYVEGQRKAIEDNWQDLTNFNQVQKGQLENMWTEATWDPALANVYMQAARNEMGTVDSMRTLIENMAAHPGNVAANNVYSANIADALRNVYRQGGIVGPQGSIGNGLGNFNGYYGYPNRDMYDPNWQQRNMPPGAQQQPQQPQQPTDPNTLEQPLQQ